MARFLEGAAKSPLFSPAQTAAQTASSWR